MQQPIDIPQRRQSSSSAAPTALHSHTSESHVLFGSPDPLNSQDQLLGAPTTPRSTIPSPVQRRRVVSAQHGSPRGPPPRERHPDQQWSLFGQMMENQGHFPATPSSALSWRDIDGDYFTRDLSTLYRSSPRVQSSSSNLRSQTGHSEEQDGLEFGDASESRRSSRVPVSADPLHPDEEYDSDDYSSSTSTLHLAASPRRSFFSFPSLERAYLSAITRNVLKCGISYLLASLFTFSPYFSRLIADLNAYGPGKPPTSSPSGHLVATIAVYFNPAKTVGAMIEADLFCLFGLFYAAFVCLLAMTLFWWLELKSGWEWLGDLIVVILIGENPSFNTGQFQFSYKISLLISIYSLQHDRNHHCSSLVKEGDLTELLQVTAIVLFGSAISNLVCFLLWPQNAISNLQNSMTQTLESFSTLLPMITKIFLLENDAESHILDMEKVQKAVESHQSSFTSLRKNLREAKSEWIFTRAYEDAAHDFSAGTGSSSVSGRESYEEVVDCLNRLGQHLNGLRSGTRLQYELTKAGLKRQTNRQGNGILSHPSDSRAVEDEQVLLKAAAAMFGDLVDELGPPMHALASASTFTLNRLREVCLQSKQNLKRHSVMEPHEFADLVDGIEAALVRFESTSNHAVLRLYRRSDASQYVRPSTSPSENVAGSASESQLTEGDNENVFLVYFFIFTLQEFAKELISLVDAIEKIYCYEQSMVRRKSWWFRMTATIRHCFSSVFKTKAVEGRRRTMNIRKSFSYMIPPNRIAHPSFPKVKPHAPDTIQTPGPNQLSFLGKVYHTLWSIGKRLKERDTKYAIKAGMATAVLAAPAFAEATRPVFLEYWGHWALISFFVVLSPTIGATNNLSLQRILGTLFGAVTAVGIYALFPDEAVILSIFGFLFSLPCYYFAVAKPKYLSASRFVLLTYNLTCLYSYNLRQKDVSVLDIGISRAIAVAAGVLWAAFVSRFWWPAEARRELTKSLSEFCLNMGWLYTRLVASNSFAPEYRDEDQAQQGNTALDTRRTRLSNSVHEFMAMELHLQIKLIELQSLLAQAQHEPRLKGPFPVNLYRQILISLQTILDKLHSMRCVTTREEWYTSVRHDFIIPVNRERREMVGNILLSFTTLSAAFRLKAPLSPYLPPVEQSRLRLVEAIRRLDVVKNRDVKFSRQLLFFAYALTMKGVTMELESLGRILQDAFGVIGQTADEFEMLFYPDAESQRTIGHVA
ncbi:hypothetical protein NLJ89_g2264 [Agrocybe chaxingu]|uniref:DUF2421 domain-containing protein n=1 Tax=Agrocybe chaxingu TaxID=84603 RepID=A0A9W8K767_9AGAR|nr:hypothetical protein NLJ89_g2264 [Agrocybe chaxingu]